MCKCICVPVYIVDLYIASIKKKLKVWEKIADLFWNLNLDIDIYWESNAWVCVL